jgi:hypothetical protein
MLIVPPNEAQLLFVLETWTTTLKSVGTGIEELEGMVVMAPVWFERRWPL